MDSKMSSWLFFLCLLFRVENFTTQGAVIRTQDLPNNRPVIGVLSQEISKELLPGIKGNSYIAASYIKYIESAGARAVPILTNFTSEQLTEVFRSVNGILLPGGGAHIPGSRYFNNAKVLFRMAIEANNAGDYFPIWGTCLGFESLQLLVDENLVLGDSNTVNIPLPLNFTHDAYRSRMFGKQTKEIMQIFEKKAVTYNFHEKCVSKATFEKSEKLKTFFDVLSFNTDENNEVFVSTIEGRKYPVYGTQWHPEKNPFEWISSLKMPHFADAIRASESVAEFFVNEARKNHHSFSSTKTAEEYLIYRYIPTFTPGGHFEQVYVF